LPVSAGACVCDDGWGGPLCDQNACVDVDCGWHGTCKASGDRNTVCVCQDGYSGDLCEVTCTGKCNGDYPFGCNVDADADRFYCGTGGGGCSYISGSDQPPNGYCLFKEKKTDNFCDNCVGETDCRRGGLCLDKTTCAPSTMRPDGTPCNSVPDGTCSNGVCLKCDSDRCTREPTAEPTDAPSATPSVSLSPTAPAPAPSESPSKHMPSPTGSPVKPVNACLGKCNGDYPFGCNDTVDADRLYCGTNGGGCSYLSGNEQPPSGYCLFKGRAPTTATPTASPIGTGTTASPVGSGNACDGKCTGDLPFECNANVNEDRLYCQVGGKGCSYLSGNEQPPAGFCLFKEN